MATKTLTITEDAYNLLKENKYEGESFSDTLRRILTKRNAKKLSDFFGILTKEEGSDMLSDLEKIKKLNIKLLKEKYESS